MAENLRQPADEAGNALKAASRFTMATPSLRKVFPACRAGISLHVTPELFNHSRRIGDAFTSQRLPAVSCGHIASHVTPELFNHLLRKDDVLVCCANV